MAFSPLVDFLSRFKNITLPNETVRKASIESIEKIIGAHVPLEATSFRNGVLYLDISGVLKSEVYLHKEEIQKEVENTLGRKIVSDIH